MGDTIPVGSASEEMQVAIEENEEIEVPVIGDEELSEDAGAYIDSVLGDDETPEAVSVFDYGTKVLVVTDQRVLITDEDDGAGSLVLSVDHDDISLMTRDGRTLVIETRIGEEHRFRFGEDETVEEIVEIVEAVASLGEAQVTPADDEGAEVQPGSESDRSGLFGRAVGAIKEKASRSVAAMTGADIRRFDEFSDATTRAVVGIHQDVAELQKQVARTERVVEDLREGERRLAERLNQLEQSINRRASLTTWILGAAGVALVLSVAAVVMSVS